MKCLPSELGVRDPYDMHWPMTESFGVRWITKSDILSRPSKDREPFQR
jgi:hypothetical protein